MSRSDGGGRWNGAPRGGSDGRSFSSRSRSNGGNSSSGRNFGSSGTMRTMPRSDSGFSSNRPSFSTGGHQSSGVRIPDATRPGYSPGAHPRAGFNTTRPDFGVRDGATAGRLTTRPDFNGRGDSARRPGVNSGRSDFSRRPDFNGRVDSARRPDFNGRNNFSRAPDSRRNFDRRGDFNGRNNFSHRDSWNFSHGRHWHGGYWNGRFWPRAYYRPHFVSFWPVLPAYYSTFWFGGVSYYYVDDLYYRWSPARYGYVVTDPPPVVESASTEAGDADDAAADNAADDEASGSASVYVYPRNGQSEEQTSNDRYECHQWAVSQTGYDPTTATGDADPATGNGPADYRRALIACLDARGYSAN
jgi:hypothetical protein